MRRVILTLIAVFVLVWLLVPSKSPAPEPAATPAESTAVVVTAPIEAASADTLAASAPEVVPQASAPELADVPSQPVKKASVGQQLSEELKGVIGGGGGGAGSLSKYNPFDN